mmetsp:Transcript_63878/g.161017  ORF Transcript_63878/g.161017 Transcript_63878/m.161017 type:complete len:626 (+) Transcript_63878:65-1942(+)
MAICACTSMKRLGIGNDPIVAAPSPHVQMMTALRALEDKLQRLDDRLAALVTDTAGNSAQLARKMDDISACLGELGLGPGVFQEEAFGGNCSPPKVVAPVAAPDFLAGSLKPLEDPQDPVLHSDIQVAVKAASAPGGAATDGALANMGGSPVVSHKTSDVANKVLRFSSDSSVNKDPELDNNNMPLVNKHKGSAIRLLQRSDDLPPNLKRINQVTEIIALSTIALNTVLMMVQLQYDGKVIGIRMGWSNADSWPDLDGLFVATEHLFNIVFVIELMVRVGTYRQRFFYNMGFMKFNIFDFTLIFATSFDLYIVRSLGGSEGSGVKVLKFIRFVRLARIFRMFGALKFFMPLRLMLSVIGHSVHSMMWAMVLLWVVMLTAAILMCQTAQTSLREGDDLTLETREWVFHHYGTSMRAMWTLIQLTFSGGWPQYAHRMVDEVNSMYSLFFFAYVFAVTFALFRIVTALLVQDTMEQAGRDAQLAVQQKMQQKERMSSRLLDFFEAADTSGDGVLTKEEWERILSNEKVKTWLSMMELSLHETQELFNMLAGSDGVVSFQEFTKGICCMKGPARSEDVMVIKSDTQRLSETTRREFDLVHGALAELRGVLTPAGVVRAKAVAASLQKQP